MQWLVYYGDGTTYSDEDGSPELAPKRNVQAVVVADDKVGRRIERSNDFYIYVPDRGIWRGVEQFGLYDYLIDDGYKIILFGRTLTDKEYSDIWSRATKDEGLPFKSASTPSERKI